VAILSHREITLYKFVDSSIKVKSMCLVITDEPVLHGEPHVTHRIATLLNDLLKIRGKRVGEPAKDDSIHPGPRRIIGEGVIGEEVVGEGVPCQGHQHQVTPDGVIGGRSVYHDVHQLANVQNRRGLDVEVGDRVPSHRWHCRPCQT
jgi:hypothetical protein